MSAAPESRAFARGRTPRWARPTIRSLTIEFADGRSADDPIHLAIRGAVAAAGRKAGTSTVGVLGALVAVGATALWMVLVAGVIAYLLIDGFGIDRGASIAIYAAVVLGAVVLTFRWGLVVLHGQRVFDRVQGRLALGECVACGHSVSAIPASEHGMVRCPECGTTGPRRHANADASRAPASVREAGSEPGLSLRERSTVRQSELPHLVEILQARVPREHRGVLTEAGLVCLGGLITFTSLTMFGVLPRAVWLVGVPAAIGLAVITARGARRRRTGALVRQALAERTCLRCGQSLSDVDIVACRTRTCPACELVNPISTLDADAASGRGTRQ